MYHQSITSFIFLETWCVFCCSSISWQADMVALPTTFQSSPLGEKKLQIAHLYVPYPSISMSRVHRGGSRRDRPTTKVAGGQQEQVWLGKNRNVAMASLYLKSQIFCHLNGRMPHVRARSLASLSCAVPQRARDVGWAWSGFAVFFYHGWWLVTDGD